MAIETHLFYFSSAAQLREFNRDVSAAKRQADHGPVVITDRGQPADDVPPHEPALNEPTEPSRTTATTQP